MVLRVEVGNRQAGKRKILHFVSLQLRILAKLTKKASAAGLFG